MKYKLLTGSHGRPEGDSRKRYFPGDVIELTREERKSLGDRVVPFVREEGEDAPVPKPKEDVVQTEVAFPDEDDSDDGSEDWSGIVALVAADVVEIITSAEREDVQAILDVELSHRGRKTVVAAAEDRLEELADQE